jgi:peptidyl-prolyl cis-trans isomerase B (cyclophilin B)
MNKYFYALVFIGIIAVFGGIVYITQSGSLVKSFISNNNMPTLPPDSSTLQVITPATQQTGQPAQQTEQVQTGGDMGPPKASISATLRTTKGTIIISLVLKDAPNAINNFVTKAKSGYYNGLTFHRVEDWVVQGGDPNSKTGAGTVGTGGNAIQTELNANPFVVGSVGMAASGEMAVGQGARISNDSQFFIVKQNADWLNGQYTNFGMVIQGMDVVNKIQVGDKILGITVE